MKLWDYKIKAPRTLQDKIWRLERQINFGDLGEVNWLLVKRHFNKLKLDPGKQKMVKIILKKKYAK